MATNLLQNDFTSGITSKKLMGRYSSAVYNNGCTDIVNFQILSQGGVTRRPGTKLMNTPYFDGDPYATSEKISLVGTRLIPFCISATKNFVIELGNGTLRVWKDNCSSLMRFIFSGTEYTTLTASQLGFSLYTTAECEEVQFAQDYEHLWIVQKNHKVLVITHSLVNQSGSLVSKLEFSQLTPTLAEGDEDNVGLFSGDDCPSKVFYYGARTWFLSSKNHPYRMWASRPYEYDNFEFYDNTETVDEGSAADVIENAIKHGEVSATTVGDFTASVDLTIWKGVVSETGSYVFINTVTSWVLNNNPVNLATYGITLDGNVQIGDTITVQFYNIDSITYKTTEVIREDNALLLEVGSSRNDEIMWMSSIGNYLIVGTVSGEWTMPGSVNGLTQQIYQASAYGSSSIQPVMAGNDIVFVQCGGSKLRGYMGGTEGFSCPDLTYTCDGLFNNKQVSHMAWRRVPDPTLYCILTDGTMAVLFYDRQYQLQGWTRWTFNGQVKDVCVVDTVTGQDVFISITRTDGDTTRNNLELFREFYVEDDYSHVDCIDDNEEHTEFYFNTPFDSYLITNGYEGNAKSGSTIGRKKRIYEANLRVLNTNSLKAMCYWGELDRANYVETKITEPSAYNVDDVEISIPGGFQKWIGFKVQSVDDKMLTALALSLMTEVE